MLPNPEYFLEKAGIAHPLIGFYDAPDTKPFEPIISPVQGRHACIFAFYRQWLNGKTLHISEENYGCGGAGTWLFNKQTRTRQSYIEFLADEEGLKSNHDLMGKWFDSGKRYKRENPNLLIGILKDEQYEFLKTITFFVNPDQLSLLMIASQYFSSPEDISPVLAQFGAGCMQMATLFEDLNKPQALIGGLDIAMRKFLEPDILTFTVTKPMYERICSISKDSFLSKSFWEGLKKSRQMKK